MSIRYFSLLFMLIFSGQFLAMEREKGIGREFRSGRGETLRREGETYPGGGYQERFRPAYGEESEDIVKNVLRSEGIPVSRIKSMVIIDDGKWIDIKISGPCTYIDELGMRVLNKLHQKSPGMEMLGITCEGRTQLFGLSGLLMD